MAELNGPAVRKINAGLYARAAWPENRPFYMTHTFTLEEEVSPAALETALETTARIYPYLTMSAVKQDRAYVLKENSLGFVIREDRGLPEDRIEPSTEAANFHAVTVSYEGRKLRFYADHVMTDGLGWKTVLQTFFYYYFNALDGTEYPVPEGVRTLRDGAAPDEQEDAYMKAPPVMPRGVIAGMADRNIFRCPEFTENAGGPGETPAELTETDCGHWVIRVPSGEFMNYARSVKGSPNSVLIQIAGQSIQRVHPENRLPVAFWIPVSARAAMGNANSLLHQVVPTVWTADPGLLTGDGGAGEISRQVREHLKAFCAPDNIRKQCGMMHMIIEGIRRSVAAGRLGQLTARAADPDQYSVLASSLGTLAAGAYGNRIRMDAFRVMPGRSFNVYLMEAGEYFYLSFSLGTKTDAYVRAAAEQMSALGMRDVSWEEVS